MNKYVRIIDKGECLSTLNENPYFEWPEERLKHIACRNEWSKNGFYPSNGLVGEIYCKTANSTNIVLINNTFYVPITNNGIEEISKSEYDSLKDSNVIKGMDDKQSNLHSDIDKTLEEIRNLFNR